MVKIGGVGVTNANMRWRKRDEHDEGGECELLGYQVMRMEFFDIYVQHILRICQIVMVKLGM
jgi:hypothetical protein